MNKSEKNGAFKAYMRIRDWCHFLGFPCGNCPFSIPPYDDDKGCFEEDVECCSLDDIIVDGDKFKGYKLPKKKIDELADRGVEIMTEEGVEKIRGAMKVITEQCRAALSCKNCPLSYYCQCMDNLFKCRPAHWFRE